MSRITPRSENKIYGPEPMKLLCETWQKEGLKVVFTNGCFDILHEGHLYSLGQAAKQADHLVVGVNSDRSVKKLKGDTRPINNEQSRAKVLASLLVTDAIVIFEEDTPLELIKTIMPDVLIKGGDYKVEDIAGAKEVIANGGKVVINPLLDGFSTTATISKMKGK